MGQQGIPARHREAQMKRLTLLALLLLSACKEPVNSWEMAYATFSPERVSGSDSPALGNH
jgi:hypothetical protein